MNIFKLFYSDLCPDTAPFVNELKRLGVSYEAINIFESMSNFKYFLNIRDNNKCFEQSKKLGNAGVPALLINDERVILALSELKILENR